MTYRKVIQRNRLQGDYHTRDTDQRNHIRGDLRRLETDQRDGRHILAYAHFAGISPRQAQIVLDLFFDGTPDADLGDNTPLANHEPMSPQEE